MHGLIVFIDCSMSKPKKAKDFFKAPVYRGGNTALRKYIADNLVYPEEALDAGIEGTVDLTYVVDGLGKVIDAEVKSGIGYSCDEEALRLVKSLVFEKAINRGFKTTSKRTIKIHFRLPRKKPQPSGTQINYQIVSSKPKEAAPAKLKKSGYNITVTINSKKS